MNSTLPVEEDLTITKEFIEHAWDNSIRVRKRLQHILLLVNTFKGHTRCYVTDWDVRYMTDDGSAEYKKALEDACICRIDISDVFNKTDCIAINEPFINIVLDAYCGDYEESVETQIPAIWLNMSDKEISEDYIKRYAVLEAEKEEQRKRKAALQEADERATLARLMKKYIG